MKIAIVGFNTDGEATYDFFDAQGGHEITICDQSTDIDVPDGIDSVLGEHYLDDLDRYDLIVRTSGMNPEIILEKNPKVAEKISTSINEFFKYSPTQNIVGVTGTKGKGTTSTMITKMLEASGKDVHLGGNIGLPPFTFIYGLDENSWVVLELSSFQLTDLQHSPHIAVCLMVVPEHLDWHRNIENYYTAKEQLFARQATGDVAVYFHDNPISKRIAGAGQAQKVPYYYPPGAEVADGKIVIEGNEICRTDELKLLGQHNWQNACAAVTAVWYACLEVCGPSQHPDISAMREVLTTFSGLPFRLRLRRVVGDIKYYNDSFASAPPAPLAAVEAIPEKQVLIIGGFDRNLDLAELAQGLLKHEAKIRKVLVIGAAGERIAASFDQHGFNNYLLKPLPDMESIVRAATELAQPGDAVVLSPGFPSFDMFKNFEDRGKQFNQAVDAL